VALTDHACCQNKPATDKAVHLGVEFDAHGA
jgi:hypothetical protein